MSELRYHHIGIPTDRPLPKKDYIEQSKVYASGYLHSPYGVEWMKFEPGCNLPELVKTEPHVAPSWALGRKPRNLSLLNREMRNL